MDLSRLLPAVLWKCSLGVYPKAGCVTSMKSRIPCGAKVVPGYWAFSKAQGTRWQTCLLAAAESNCRVLKDSQHICLTVFAHPWLLPFLFPFSIPNLSMTHSSGKADSVNAQLHPAHPKVLPALQPHCPAAAGCARAPQHSPRQDNFTRL